MSDGKYLDRPGFRWLVNKLKNTYRKLGSIIPISEGGTGATNAADAREALGVREFIGVSGSIQSVSGLLPEAPAGGEDKVFYGNGEWNYIKEFRGVSGSIQSISGLLPGAPADGEDKVFYGRGEWDYIKEFRGVSGSIQSMSGLLPGAPAGGEDMVFYGRGEWGPVQGGGGHDDLIAPVESASGSEHAYAIGDQFIIEGVLYIATAAIAVGDAFVVGTNCAINQNITDQIKAIVDSYVTGIKGNAESSYRKGNVNITPANIGLADNSVKDYNNNTPTKFGYSTSGMARADATWLGAWDASVNGEYRLRAVKQADLNVNKAASADDSSKLNGYESDTAASKNTIVRRNSSGYVYAVYYNQSSSEETSATNARPCIIDGSGWHRKFGIAAFRNLIGLGNTTGALPVANGGTGQTAFRNTFTITAHGASDVASIAVNSRSSEYVITCSKSNYYPLGVISYNIPWECALVECLITNRAVGSCKLHYVFRNCANSASPAKGYREFDILWCLA